MHPPQADNLLFRGIPPQANRGFGKLAASFSLHVVVIGLLAFATPAVLVNRPASLRLYTPLIAPPQAPAIPTRPPVAVVTQPPEPRVTRQFVAPVPPRAATPKLEAAPELVNAHRPELVLPTPLPVEPIQRPVQTGVFGSNAPARPNPVLPIAPASSAGFDTSTRQATAAAFSRTAVGGFDMRETPNSRSAPANARVHTGGFGTASDQEHTAPTVASKVTRAGFNVAVENPQPESPNSAVRKTSFDEVKAVAAAVPGVPKTAATRRPVEIIDKPKPAYTTEARAKRVEGDVLLDVIFTAGGEVRVLGVRRGLGHGLDENAIDAARHIRFHPAIEAGMPVDQRAVLHIIFQITG